MRVIFARHGNTFAPGETPVWVGAKEDLPLVPKGLEQARALRDSLKERGFAPARIISGPLQRTWVAAMIVAEGVDQPVSIEIDLRLREIDYGSWGGRSDDEIAEKYGAEAIELWRQDGIVPETADWSPSQDELRLAVSDFVDGLIESAGDDVVVVTSNGILRFIHEKLDAGAKGFSDHKVKTGHVCETALIEGEWQVMSWNEKPEDFAERKTK